MHEAYNTHIYFGTIGSATGLLPRREFGSTISMFNYFFLPLLKNLFQVERIRMWLGEMKRWWMNTRS